MIKESSVFRIDLNTPEGKALVANIKSSISILVEVSDETGIDLRVLLDHDKALNDLGQFLKETTAADPHLLNGREVNSVNVTPEYLYEPSTTYNRFTPGENDTMELISAGEIDKGIAHHLDLEKGQIRARYRQAYKRMNVNNRVNASNTYKKIKGEVYVHSADIATLLHKMGF
jgi:DNA-binding NarL/FixJ family response regulator